MSASPLDELPIAAQNLYAVERIEKLVAMASDLRTGLPSYLGMTAYGSIVRGEATAKSDVDGFVYVRPVADEISRLERTDSYPYRGTCTFDALRRKAHDMLIGHLLVKHALPVDRHTIEILPVTSKIIHEQIGEVLRVSGAFKPGTLPYSFLPRNIRGLFHASIDEEGLREYRQQVVGELAHAPGGEQAWSALYYAVAVFEVGREQYAPLGLRVTHRQLPLTLAEARDIYSA